MGREVLNALRHQRFGTYFGVYRRKYLSKIKVLNALRHQRFGTYEAAAWC